MRVIPGSHRGRLRHHTSEDGRYILQQEINEEQIDLTTAVDLELKAGEISLHHDGIAHGIEQNGFGKGIVATPECAQKRAIILELDLRELKEVGSRLDGLVIRTSDLNFTYDISEIAAEQTVRGEFVRDAFAQLADDESRRRVVVTGLRAFDGRRDLEVL